MKMSHKMTKALDARCCLAMSRIIADKEEAERMELAACGHAYDLGFLSNHSNDPISPLLAHESVLICEWESGKRAAAHSDLLDSLYPVGTEEEWNALSDEDKAEVWEEFHSLCAIGIGDTMYFYDVLMNLHQVGYVGH